ncbi:molecular chaperone HtpG, partial [Pseudomonas sp. SWRI111]
IDEFAIKMIANYKEKEFKSVSSGDLGLNQEEEKAEKEATEENKALFDYMKDILSEKVKGVKVSTRLKSHPVCLTAEGEVSIEMEKV